MMSFITPDVLTLYQPYARVSAPRHAEKSGWVGRLLKTWRARSRERQALAKLDSRDLRDIGLSRWEVEQEVAKPFWRG
jgi:uncharacterized protein YjiS (DUF1127 family)